MFSFVYFLTLAYFLVLLPRYFKYRNRAYLVLIGWGVLSSVYELGAGRWWLSKDAIRIDIFFIMIVTAMLYLVLALAYWQRSSQQESACAAISRQHALYLTPPLLLLVGLYFYLLYQTRISTQSINASKQNFLAACLAKPATQFRCFGELTSKDSSQLTGYFKNVDNAATYRELLINQAGDYYLISSDAYLSYGKLELTSTGDYQLSQDSGNLTEAKLIQQNQQQLQLRLNYPGQAPVSFAFQRTPLPSRTVTETKAAAVRFTGVFSALESQPGANNFWLTQVWIWRDQEKSWGYFLRRNYSYGGRDDFPTVVAWQQTCSGVCSMTALQFLNSGSRYELQQITTDSWQFKRVSDSAVLTLKRGQYIPVLMLDQAPLDTTQHNQQWLADLTRLYHSAWLIPSAQQLRAF